MTLEADSHFHQYTKLSAIKSLPFPTPLSATATQHPGSTPATAVIQNFPEAPKGPSNPFSQPPPTLRENTFSSQNQPVPPPPPDLQPNKSSFTAVPSQDARQAAPHNIPQPSFSTTRSSVAFSTYIRRSGRISTSKVSCSPRTASTALLLPFFDESAICKLLKGALPVHGWIKISRANAIRTRS